MVIVRQPSASSDPATLYEAITSPATALLVREDTDACAGIMITASHNPASDNGLKVLGADGDKLNDDIELELEKMLGALSSDEIQKLIDDIKNNLM